MEEPNPYNVKDYHNDDDPDSRIASYKCQMGQYSSNLDQQPNEDPGVHEMAQQNTVPMNTAESSTSQESLVDSDGNPSGNSGDSIDTENDGISGGAIYIGPAQGITKRARGFRRRAEIQVGTSE